MLCYWCLTPGESEYQILVEPGRSLVASTAGLVCRVLGTKLTGSKRFAIIDGSMTELVRPALYQAHHHVVPCVEAGPDLLQYDLVGPVCESADCLATAVHLPALCTGQLGTDKQQISDHFVGDLLVILDTGAYGACMASNYNMRSRPVELLVEGDTMVTVADKEDLDQLLSRFKM